MKGRYKYTKYFSNPKYEKEYKDKKDRQIRKMTNKEITALENIKIKDGFWYWEPFYGYLRVYKKCLEKTFKSNRAQKLILI